MHDLAAFRRAFRCLALGCSAASAILAFVFGINQSPQLGVAVTIAVFFVAISFAADYIWLFIAEAFRLGRRGLAAGLLVGGFVVLSLNIVAHIGSVGWHRDIASTEAKVVNTRADMAADQVRDNTANLALWRKHLAALEAEHAWAATVSADALRAELPVKDEAIVQEERRGGCARKCLALKAEKAEVEKRIGIVEAKADLTRKIEATQRLLSQSREKASHTERKVAAGASQAEFFASLATLSLEASPEAATWTTRGIATWIAVGLCLAPILFSLIGWGVVAADRAAAAHAAHRGDVVGHTTANSAPLVPVSVPSVGDPGRTHIVQQTFHDRAFARTAADVLKAFQPTQLRTA